MSLIAELVEQVDTLAKRAEGAVKKVDLKLRRGRFEVPATPVDRRRAPPLGSATSMGGTSLLAGWMGGSSGGGGGGSGNKRSYAAMVHEIETRELQYQLQNELKLEIERQSAAATAGGGGGAGGDAGGGGTGSALTASGGSGAGGAGGGAGGGESEPVYCTCRKVSFGAMVACSCAAIHCCCLLHPALRSGVYTLVHCSLALFMHACA